MEEKELLQEQEQEETPALEGIQELEQQEEQPEEQEEQIEEQQAQQASQKEENIRALREAKIRAERERDQLMREREEYQRYLAYQQQMQQQMQPQEDYNINIAADDIAEGKHLHKINKRLQKMEQDYQQRLQVYEQQAAALAVESRLRVQFPDIDKVINAENIAYLREHEPEFAMSLNANQDLYSKSVAAYKIIKKLGLHAEPEDLQAQAQYYQNVRKPLPSNAISVQQKTSPISQASAYGAGLTKEMKAQARRELAEILGK
jgi:hypothetical protein